MAYDAASQTTQVFHRTSAGASLLQQDYKYDPAGNRIGMAENVSAARTTWSYDKQNQLTGENRTGTNAYRQTFTYDAGSNRTLKNVDGTRTTYAYDAANQLKYGQAVAGRTTFAYDLTGNQKIEQPPTGNRTTTTWNYENQPTQYLLPVGSRVTMSYNGENRRVISQQGTDTTKFVWDRPIDAYLSELDGTNAVQAVYTNEPQKYGSVVSQRRGSTSSTLHADALGTTRLLTTSAQATSDTYLYDAWGNLIASSGTTVNPFRWVGRYGYYQDSNTGLVYVRGRMYQPAIARWLSVDPFGFADGINRFLHNGNTIGFWIDPSGGSRIPINVKMTELTVIEPVQSAPAVAPPLGATGCRLTIVSQIGNVPFEPIVPFSVVPGDCGKVLISLSGAFGFQIVAVTPLFPWSECEKYKDSSSQVANIEAGGECRSNRECPPGKTCKLDLLPWELPIQSPSLVYFPTRNGQCLLTVKVTFERLKILVHTGKCDCEAPDFDLPRNDGTEALH